MACRGQGASEGHRMATQKSRPRNVEQNWGTRFGKNGGFPEDALAVAAAPGLHARQPLSTHCRHSNPGTPPSATIMAAAASRYPSPALFHPAPSRTNRPASAASCRTAWVHGLTGFVQNLYGP